MDNNQPASPPTSQPAPATSPQMTGFYKAGIIRRYLAVLVDNLIFIPINLILFFFTAILLGRDHSNLLLLAAGPVYYILISSIVWFIYNVFFILRNGSTPGKKLLKIKVISITEESLKPGQVVIRESIGKFLSGLILNLGYLWALHPMGGTRSSIVYFEFMPTFKI